MKLKTVKPVKKRTKEKRQPGDKFRNRVLPILMVTVCSVMILAFSLPTLLRRNNNASQKQYTGVVELWNVETFEGGSGSRSSWLTARAANFEKTHKGLFVHVTDLTPQQMSDKLENGETFDIVCFSRGVGTAVQPLLVPYTGSVADIRDNVLVSGEVQHKVYALPLYCGSYSLFARTSQLPTNVDLIATALSNTYSRKVGKITYDLQPLVCGFTAYNSPLSALALSGGRGSVNPDETLTQYGAYESFIADKTAVTLLGTQRDLYRLDKRLESGKIEQLTFAPLVGYTDLVQYLGISSSAGDKTDSCTEFLQYLVSKSAQQTLTGINMFAVLQHNFYTDEKWLCCEKGLSDAYVPNVFGDEASVASQRKAAISTLEMQ